MDQYFFYRGKKYSHGEAVEQALKYMEERNLICKKKDQKECIEFRE